MAVQDKLAEGKTKIIFPSENPQHVVIESKDSITAGDGAKKDVIEGKGIFSNQTTSHVFEFLNACGIKTHFIKQLGDRQFLAWKCDMIPLEVVVRRLAFGSYLKRHPGTPEKFRFTPPLVEFFLKDDVRHDPFMEPFFILHEKTKSRSGKLLSIEHLETMEKTCRLAFEILEKAWASLDVVLVDLKVEFGFDPNGNLLLSDVIDNDSWRIWLHGDKAQMKDKQIYRNLPQSTPEALQALKTHYEDVANMTSLFLKPISGNVVVLLEKNLQQEIIQPMVDWFLKLEIPHEILFVSPFENTEIFLKQIWEREDKKDPVVFIAVEKSAHPFHHFVAGNTLSSVFEVPVNQENFSFEALKMIALASAKILALSSPLLYGKLLVIKG
jgi:phosphoribosylaminoimidazole carboxylase/phosphoribosylaminoimidazole-succinocarboxamide synthase